MRTLPLRRGTRGLACLTLAVVLGGGGAASWIVTHPVQAGRWGYRAAIRARGGDFVSFPGVVSQTGLSDCGPAALATLITYLGGSSPSLDSLAVLAGTDIGGTRFDGLLGAARHLGITGSLERLDTPAMQHLSTPVIAWVDRSHFVTVAPETARTVLILDPLAGPYRVERDRLQGFWSGEALVPTSPRHSGGFRGGHLEP